MSLRSPRRETTPFPNQWRLSELQTHTVMTALASDSCELFDEINRLASADRSSFATFVERLQPSPPLALTSGAVVTRSSVKLDVEHLPRKLAIDVQNVLWSRPAAREALLNLLQYYLPEMSLSASCSAPVCEGTTSAAPSFGSAYVHSLIAHSAAVSSMTPNSPPTRVSQAINFRLERSVVHSSSLGELVREPALFVSVWSLLLEPTSHSHDGDDIAGLTQALSSGLTRCLLLGIARMPGANPSWALGCWEKEHLGENAYACLLQQMLDVFERHHDPAQAKIRLQHGQLPRLCLFADDPETSRTITMQIDAMLSAKSGLRVVHSVRVTYSPGC